MQRWAETEAWANANGCAEIVNAIMEEDFYFVDRLSNYEIGPLGGPMYRDWDFETKARPSHEALELHMKVLSTQWLEVVGSELGVATRPTGFSGRKARRLVVNASPLFRPPWGGWAWRSKRDTERREFTRFRAAINDAIAPHEIDHVDFVLDEKFLKKGQ